jgi:ADP-heptose:LPS heptosyltransferase
MSDTPPSVDGLFRSMLSRKSPAERLRMCTTMFGTAKALAIAGIRQRRGETSEDELRERLFLHFYGSELSKSEQRAILESMRQAFRDSGLR